MATPLDVPIRQRVKFKEPLVNINYPILAETLVSLGESTTPTWSPPLPEHLIGVEIEVERAGGEKVSRDIPSDYVMIVSDGSLRNNGLEFVTCPHPTHLTEALLRAVMKRLPEKHEFSLRTSIHVHMNVRELTMGQLASLLYTYLIFEKLLYKWVGSGREDSIFCIPLQQTVLPKNIHRVFTSGASIHWTKYCGLNLSPYQTKGTVEFRHLFGTKDVDTILQWIRFLSNMMRFAKEYSNEYIVNRITNLNTNSEYRMFLEEVFQEDARIFADDSSLNKHMAAGVAYFKGMAFYNPFQEYLMENFRTTSEIAKRLFLSAPVKRVQKVVGSHWWAQAIEPPAQNPTGLSINQVVLDDVLVHLADDPALAPEQGT